MLELVDTADPPLRWLCLDGSAVDDVDFTAGETLRSVFAILRQKGIRPVVAQVMEDLKADSRYRLHGLFDADALYETLEDVLTAYRTEMGGD